MFTELDSNITTNITKTLLWMPYKYKKFTFNLDAVVTLTFVAEYNVYMGKGLFEMPDEMFRMIPHPLQKQTR